MRVTIYVRELQHESAPELALDAEVGVLRIGRSQLIVQRARLREQPGSRRLREITRRRRKRAQRGKLVEARKAGCRQPDRLAGPL